MFVILQFFITGKFYFAGILYDNALTIHDYSGFYVSINNERYTTDVPADDGKWHHIAVSWTSATGQVLFYKDGSRVSQGTIEKNRVSYTNLKNSLIIRKIISVSWFYM